ncbi:MAG: AlpA family phage regulatory protein [Synergistaceae bacterium]|jgi:predicted DNA-binding transcriptional regulator AlpA|nr:AlpA family phage regulatory protein [Synergistaceae bacterium]
MTAITPSATSVEVAAIERPDKNERYLTARAVAERLAISTATIWRWLRLGQFPAPKRFGSRCCRWPLSAVAEWEASR